MCVLVAAVTGGRAQDASLISAARRVDWAQAGAEVIHRTAQCGSTIAAYSGSAGTINDAIANCPSGQVVQLGSGTFTLSSGILFTKDNITLRGAGPNSTRLVFTSAGGTSCFGITAVVCVRGTDEWWAAGDSKLHFFADWTGGYAKGASTLTLSDTSGMPVGTILTLDQLNDGGDTGQVWVCTSTACSREGGNSMGRRNRAQQQMVRVTGVNGNSVTIAPSLAMPNWRSSQSPGAMWGSDVVSGAGIEDLSIDTSAVEVNSVTFFHAYDCWLRNIRSFRPRRAHVVYWHGAHITIRDSYFEEGQTHASQSYGVESFVSSDNLVENNIFHRVTSPLMVNGTCTGCVFGYNYSLDHVYAGDFMIPGANPHEGGIDMVLFEGNDQNAFYSDNIHGTRHFVTLFRNRFSGVEPGKTSDTNPVQIAAFGRYHNVVGNVLGQSGYHTNYTWNLSGADPDKSVFKLGEGRGTANDPLVATTLLRWGNYDVATSSARFVSAEVPSSIALFPNAVPSGESLPASFYRSSRPAWFGAAPWPAIGPDVRDGDVSGADGHAYRIPARVCYETGAKDSNGALTNFDGRRCYGEPVPSRPRPPTPAEVHVIR